MERRFRWGVLVGALLLAAGVGAVAYNAGVSHGLAINLSAGTGPEAGGSAPAVAPGPYGPYPPYAMYRYGWGFRPWGFGVLTPFLFLLFWFFVFRLLFWGGFGWRRWNGGGPDARARFDEWHRRAHETDGAHLKPNAT